MNLPSITMRQHTHFPLSPRLGLLNHPLGPKLPNVLIIPDIIHKHLLRRAHIRLPYTLPTRTLYPRRLLHPLLQLPRRIGQIHRCRPTRDQILQLLHNEDFDLFRHARDLHVDELDGEAEGRNYGDGWRASGSHVFDGVPGVCGGVYMVVVLCVGETELV